MDFVNFFSSWSRTFKPTKISHFFSFIGKDLDKEATCHRNLFPFLCVCACECTAEPHQSHTELQRAEHVSMIGCTVEKFKLVLAHICAHAHTHTHNYFTLDGILYLDNFVSAF